MIFIKNLKKEIGYIFISSSTTIAAGRCLDCYKKFRLDKEVYTCLTCNNRYICKTCFYENHPLDGKKLKLKYYNI